MRRLALTALLATGLTLPSLARPTSATTSPAPATAIVGSDDCGAAQVIVGTGLFAFDNTLATTGTEGQSEARCDLSGAGTAILQDVWFTWTAPATGIARLRTCGFTTVDTKVAVYESTGCPTTAAIACNDDACTNYQSTVTWSALAGQPYAIQLGLYPGSSPTAIPGTGQFELVVFTTPANDDCATPTTIAGFGAFPFDNVAATTGVEGQGNALCHLTGAGTTILQDVWYEWTSPITGNVQFSTCSAHIDTKMAAYDGAGCPVAPAIACNDDSCDYQSNLLLSVTTGSTYVIQLGLYPGTNPRATPGTGHLEIHDTTPPSNDDCATPTVIAGPGSHAYDSTFASTGAEGQTEVLCDFSGDPAISNDQWYVWTPDASGTATLSTCLGTAPGASADTKVAIYAGAGCPTSPAIACNDDDGVCAPFGFASTVTWPVTCGETYTIQLGRYPTSTLATFGTFELALSGNPCDTGTTYCDGSIAATLACPCANPGATGHGCANSLNPDGARLHASGHASLANDTLLLAATGMPNSSCLYFQGTAEQAGGIGVLFGDGKRCVGGSVVRLGTKSNVAGASSYPEVADPSVSVRGLVTTPGTWTYQAWYRNAADYCTPSTFNLTNGRSVTWSL